MVISVTLAKRHHVGWNEVRFGKTASLFEQIDQDTDFYFVHSYAFEAREFVGGKFLIAYGDEVAFDHVVEGEMNLGAAYVACEDHLAELQCAGIG